VCWGPAFPYGGPDPGGLGDCPRGGVRHGLPCLLTIVRGTPVQGTDSGPRALLRGGYDPVGGAKACMTYHFRALADATVANLSSVVLPAPSVPIAGRYMAPASTGFVGLCHTRF
jgi:hypothetical protein